METQHQTLEVGETEVVGPPSEIQELQTMYGNLSKAEKEKRVEVLKESLREKAFKLQDFEDLKTEFELKIKELNQKIEEVTTEIRREWEPLTLGSEKSVLDCNGVLLEMKMTLNVKADDKEQAVDWFLHNGFKDVLKYDIHHGTMKKIATERHQEGGDPIPGLTYSNFNVVKIRKGAKK